MLNRKSLAGGTLLAVLALLSWYVNSSPSRAGRIKLGGEVTVDGEPLEFGTILLTDASGENDGISVNIVDGVYEATSNWAGTANVQIRAPKPGTGQLAPPPPLEGKDINDRESRILVAEHRRKCRYQERLPPKYHNNSVLKIEIEEDGENEHNFELKSQ
jgi:hypothetical protein